MAALKRKSNEILPDRSKKVRASKGSAVKVTRHSSGSDSDSSGGVGVEDDFVGFGDLNIERENKQPTKPAIKPAVKSKKSVGGAARKLLAERSADKRIPYRTPTEIKEDLRSQGTTSREAHAKQKAEKQERRAAKPNADAIQRSKVIWEKLRRKSHTEKEQRDKLVAELFDIINGRVKDLIFKHDAGRAIQCALKYANLEQRRMIASELRGSYVELAKGKYSKHFVEKLLSYDDHEVRGIIVPEFYGHVKALLRHSEASWILDDMYRVTASPVQKATLLREWYGAQFIAQNRSSTAALPSDLETIFEQNPEFRPAVMRQLSETINQLVQTQRNGFTLLHDAMLQYFLALRPGSDELRAFVELIRGDDDDSRTLIRNLAFSRSGAQILCYILAHGNAKDRKMLLRAFRETDEDNASTGTLFSNLASDKFGYLILLTAFETVDDTVLMSKTVLADLLGKDPEAQTQRVLDLALHPVGRIIIKELLAPPPPDAETGRPESFFVDRADAAIMREVIARRAETSKKDPVARRAELRRAASPALLTAVSNGAQDLLCSPSEVNRGPQFIIDALTRAEGDKGPAMEAVCEAVEGDPQADDHVGGNKVSVGKMLKTLVGEGEFDKKTKELKKWDPPLGFANVLFPHIREHLVKWATSMSSFVVVNMMQSSEFTQKTKALKTFQNATMELREASVKGNTGAKILLGML